jgi:multimeric flavodoxin WrbA
MTIIGVSGSPIVQRNTDRIVQALLEQSGRDHRFVNLSTLRYDPCRACAHLCAPTNMCPIEDDLHPYMEPILTAEALVLGTSVTGGNITAWMYSFLSRLWCFRHVQRLLRDKPVLFVAAGLFQRSKYRVLPKVIDYV